jgi:Flagellar hook capping protein
MAVNNIDDALLNAVNTRNVKSSTKSAAQETEDRFLKLLIAQMQNQDPLNPMENAEVTSQMAQLSTVTGITQLNETLSSLMASLSSNQTLEAAAMIGHGVLVSGDSMVLSKADDIENEDGSTTTGQSLAIFGVDMESSATNVTVNIYNEKGALIKTMNIGAADAGVIPVSWDGSTNDGDTALPGKYTFTVEAKSGGESVKANPLAFGEVLSVTKGADNSVLLNVLTVGSVKLSDIRQIL